MLWSKQVAYRDNQFYSCVFNSLIMKAFNKGLVKYENVVHKIKLHSLLTYTTSLGTRRIAGNLPHELFLLIFRLRFNFFIANETMRFGTKTPVRRRISGNKFFIPEKQSKSTNYAHHICTMARQKSLTYLPILFFIPPLLGRFVII